MVEREGIALSGGNVTEQAVLQGLLEREGYRVQCVDEAELPVETISVYPPALVIFDLCKPGSNGLEICRALKEHPATRTIPVILLQENPTPAQRVAGFQAGASDFITKPCLPEELLARIRNYCELSRLRSQLEARVKEHTAEVRATNRLVHLELAERQQTECRLKKELDRGNRLLQLYEKAPQLTEKELYDYVLDQAVALTDSTVGFFHLITDDQQEIILTTWNAEALKSCMIPQETHYAVGQAGNWVDCLRYKRPVIYNDFPNSPHQKGLPAGHTPLRRFMSIPVMEGDKVRIIFGVGNKAEAYQEQDVTHIQLVANELQKIIHQRHVDEALRESQMEIVQLNQDLEQRVLERTAQLETANRELEAFAYSISHDLRAPLRHIHGFVEMLREENEQTLNETSHRYIQVIATAATHMGTLIDDLLEFARMSHKELTKAPVDLGEIVREVMDELQPETHLRQIDWQVAELPVVTGDRAMLRLVMVNLISNAIKYTRPRPLARIEIGRLPASPTEDGFYVRDNGVGFDMKYVDKLFGVFQRLHRTEEFEGNGIGLAHVRRIIDRHSGRTWAEGQENQGATLYFTLSK